MTARTIATVARAERHDIADLMTRTPLPGRALPDLDPFLLLNHHGPQTYGPNNGGLPFGPHPHRGFETVTFILDGTLAHHDTGGHESVIAAGGVQWMTAGSGLIHAEVSPAAFKRAGGSLEILQLWVNLPARLKMTAPRYTGLQATAIPDVALPNEAGVLHLVSGAFDGQAGPVETLTGVFMSWVDLKSGGAASLPAPNGRRVLFYVVRGDVTVAGKSFGAGTMVDFADDGDTVEVAATTNACLLYGHADPLNEPIVARGPFVMNTEAEIARAHRDYQAGMFDGSPITLERG